MTDTYTHVDHQPTIVVDDELGRLNTVTGALGAMDPPERTRAIGYLLDRFAGDVPHPPAPQRGRGK